MKKLKYKFLYWFYEKFAERDSIKTNLGYGDFDEERGWIFRSKFVSAEKYLK